MISLSQKLLKQIREIAEGSYPFECCGILAGRVEAGGDDRTILRVLPAENERSDSPENRYLISPEFVLEAEKDCQASGHLILGFFHSHPDVAARPSRCDLEHAWPWYAYLIVSVCQGRTAEVANWRLKDDRSEFEAEKMQIE